MGKSVRREVEFSLAEGEIVEKAMRVASLSKQVDALEAEFKEIAKAHRGRVAELERQVRQELAVIMARKESRTVECEIEKDFDKNVVRYLHNALVVEERVMEAHERQDEMDLEGTKADDDVDDFLEDDDDEFAPPAPAAKIVPELSRARVSDLPSERDREEGAA